MGHITGNTRSLDHGSYRVAVKELHLSYSVGEALFFFTTYTHFGNLRVPRLPLKGPKP